MQALPKRNLNLLLTENPSAQNPIPTRQCSDYMFLHRTGLKSDTDVLELPTSVRYQMDVSAISFTSISLRCHFVVTSGSLRFHIRFIPMSFRSSTSLRSPLDRGLGGELLWLSQPGNRFVWHYFVPKQNARHWNHDQTKSMMFIGQRAANKYKQTPKTRSKQTKTRTYADNRNNERANAQTPTHKHKQTHKHTNKSAGPSSEGRQASRQLLDPVYLTFRIFLFWIL